MLRSQQLAPVAVIFRRGRFNDMVRRDAFDFDRSANVVEPIPPKLPRVPAEGRTSS